MSSELITRVRSMEEDYNAVAEAVKALEEAVAGFEEVACRLQRLSEYMVKLKFSLPKLLDV